MSKALNTELVNFEALARDDDSARRGELARHVATLFSLTSETCSDEQIDIYDSVLSRLIDMVEEEARCFVAGRLAKLRRAPENTTRKLAQDCIAVARPILEHSTLLRDLDLVEIVEQKNDDHRYAIAGREVLSELVTDALVNKGGARVKRRVAANEGASFSDTGVMRLIEAANADEELQLALGSRVDLADEHIMALVSIASERVRVRLIEANDRIGAARLPQATRLAARRMSNDFWLSRYDFETAMGRVLTIARSEGIDERTLRRFAAEDRFPEAVAAFAMLADIGLEEAKHWMVRPDTDPFLIVAKASGFSTMTIQALLKIGPWRYRLTSEARAEAYARYDNLKIAAARSMLAQWQGRLAC